MRFINPIPFVRDIDRSREFYRDRLGLKILEDHGNFVLFETGFAIHEATSLEQTIWGEPSGSTEPYGRRNVLLYFEHEDIDAAFEAIAPHVELIHPVEPQAGGQRVFRFYEPDGHAVEVGEPLDRAISVISPETYAEYIARLDAPAQPNERLKRTMTAEAPWDEA
jgi:catechol 2,3-dioxygenase-like lactoylglutathione lyase family enzyme